MGLGSGRGASSSCLSSSQPTASDTAPVEPRAIAAVMRIARGIASVRGDANVGLHNTHTNDVDGDGVADALNMDHVHMNFSDYLWVWYFVGVNAFYLWASGITKMLGRAWLMRKGCIKPRASMYLDGQARGQRVPYDPRRLVGKLCLEGLQVVRYDGKEAAPEGGSHAGPSKTDEIAYFRWHQLPYLTKENTFARANLLEVQIALPSKLMHAATLDGEPLTPNQAIILIWFDTIFAFHVKLHAYANWSVNVSDKHDNKYMRRASTITVMYNYFGHSIFPAIARTWYRWGWTQYKWDAIEPVIEAGISDGLRPHYAHKLVEISKYSNICRFVHQLREPFLKAFEWHKDDFPQVNGDAFYIGTVMHSLDHTNMAWNMEDALWLDTDDERFGHLAEAGRFVRAGFVDDLPGVCWPRRFKRATHPFYRSIYKQAARIDRRLADHMDTAIIK